jgi:anti-sigma factor RsiW
MTAGLGPIGEDDLQAYIDGRLSGARHEQAEAYIAAHPELRDRVARDREHRESLRLALAGKFAEPIPARLRIENIRAGRRAATLRRFRAVAAAGLIFVAGILSGWVLSRALPVGSPAAGFAVNASAAYRTFVVEVAHPVEVDAAHEEHLLRWLSKRLGRQLAAPDLARFGYRLIGGRLLPAGGGAAAQLMYEDGNGGRLTLYVQADDGAETAFRFRQESDTATLAWVDRGFGFAVTAHATREQLLPIAEAIYRDLDQGQGNVPDRGRS